MTYIKQITYFVHTCFVFKQSLFPYSRFQIPANKINRNLTTNHNMTHVNQITHFVHTLATTTLGKCILLPQSLLPSTFIRDFSIWTTHANKTWNRGLITKDNSGNGVYSSL